jgi:hypothetical protein
MKGFARLLNVLKFMGYGLLAVFIYMDFILSGVFSNSESISVEAVLLNEKLIYTSIIVAVLEAIGNIIDAVKPD